MSAAPAANVDETRRFGLALIGLVLVLVSPLLLLLTMDSSLLQRTGLAMWAAMVVGLACTGLAAWKDSRTRTRVAAALSLLWVLFAVATFAILMRLPSPTALGEVDRVSDVVLSNQNGDETSLRDLLRSGPVLLVFYRGHW